MTETAEEPAQKENPLAEGLALRRTPDPCALVIFGASGDLTHKKLMPALYALAVRQPPAASASRSSASRAPTATTTRSARTWPTR